MAGRNIKGITVEIGGDTGPLKKALKDVDSQIRSTQLSLKDIDKLLKFSPSSTVLLKQKQEELSKAVSGTRERLETLKKAQVQYKESGKDLGSESYKALEREIVQTESKLKGLTRQQKEFGSVSRQQLLQVSDKMQQVSGKISSVGSAMSRYVSVPIAAAGAASIKAFDTVDTGLDTITKKTGATGKAAESLGESYKNVASSMNVSFEDTGNAIGEVSTRFGLTGKKLESLTGTFLKFASVNDTDVTSSVGNVQRVMSQFNIPVSDAAGVLGAFTNTAQKTGQSVDDLFSEVQQYGGAFKKMNLPVGAAVQMLGSFEKAGYSAGTMMKALNKANIYAMKNGMSVTDVLKKLSSELGNSATRAQGEKDAIEIMGARSAGAFISMAESGKFSMDSLSGDLSQYSGTVDKTFKSTEDGIDNYKQALNSFTEAGYEIGDSISTMIGPALLTLAKGLKSFADSLAKMPNAVKCPVLALLGIAAAAGPVLSGIGKIGFGVSALVKGFASISPLLGGLSGGFLKLASGAASAAAMIGKAAAGFIASLGPAGLIAIGIAALVTAFIVLWHKSKAFRDFWKGLWKDIKAAANAAADAVVSKVKAAVKILKSVVSGFKSFISLIGKGIKAAVHAVASVVSSAVRKVVSVFKGLKEKLMWFAGLGRKAYRWGRDMVTGFIKGIASLAGSLFKKVKGIASFIAGHLHFSVPEEGPLKNFDKSGSDMVDLFINGIDERMGALRSSVSGMSGALSAAGNVSSGGNVAVDSSGITDAVRAGMASGSAKRARPVSLTVKIGERTLEAMVVSAVKNVNLKSGGY